MGGWLNKVDSEDDCQAIKREVYDLVHSQGNCPGNASVCRSMCEEIPCNCKQNCSDSLNNLFEVGGLPCSLYLHASYVASFTLPDWEL